MDHFDAGLGDFGPSWGPIWHIRVRGPEALAQGRPLVPHRVCQWYLSPVIVHTSIGRHGIIIQPPPLVPHSSPGAFPIHGISSFGRPYPHSGSFNNSHLHPDPRSQDGSPIQSSLSFGCRPTHCATPSPSPQGGFIVPRLSLRPPPPPPPPPLDSEKNHGAPRRTATHVSFHGPTPVTPTTKIRPGSAWWEL